MAADRARQRRAANGGRAAAAALALALAIVLAAAPARASLSNELTAWTDLAQQAVRTVGIQNQLSTRVYALVGLAAHQAIESNPSVDPALAAAYASHTVLSTLFPWLQSSTYDALLKKQLGDKNQPARAARDKIRSAAGDLVKKAIGGASAEFSNFKFAPDGTTWGWQLVPGKQQYALYPQLADATPLVETPKRLEAIAKNTDAKKGPVFRPPTPRTADYATTYKLGNATAPERSEYNTGSATFWADGANTSTIAGHWLNVSLAVLPQQTTVPETALFLARAFGAAWDASIAGFKVKYSVLQWRPITAFRQGYPAQGSVPAFAPDPYFTPLINTPPHPEYLSGHQVTVGAILEVLLRTLGGKDAVALSIGSEGTPALGERKYTSLNAAAVEVGDSRVYGGVHFNASSTDGLNLGRLVGGEVFEKLKSGGGKGRRFV